MLQRDILIAELQILGLREVETRSTKYRAFTKTGVAFYFVGKNGALRYGRNVTEANAVELTRQRLIASYHRRTDNGKK